MRKLQIAMVTLAFFLLSAQPIILGESNTNELMFSKYYSESSSEGNITGCTNSSANNYDINATIDDGSCDYDLDDDGVLDVDEIPGCTDSRSFRLRYFANNYNPNATDDDGSCNYDIDGDGVLDVYEVLGCTDSNISANGVYFANNYDPYATEEDGSCDYDLDDDGILDIDEIYGCTDPSAMNYDANATKDDGACVDPPSGGFTFSSSQAITDFAYAVKFSPNGEYYAIQHNYRMIIWNSTTKSNETTVESVGRILDFDWSPNGDKIFMFVLNYSDSKWTDYEIVTYNTTTQQTDNFVVDNFVSHYLMDTYLKSLGEIELNYNGTMFAISYNNNTLVYNSSNFEIIWNYTSPFDNRSSSSWCSWGNCLTDYHRVKYHQSVSWSNDGKRIAFSSSEQLLIYETENWSHVRNVDLGDRYLSLTPIVDVASYSPNGEYLMSCSSNDDLSLNDKNGELLWKHTGLTWIVGGCSEIIWSPDSSMVLISFGSDSEFGSSLITYSVDDMEIIDWLSPPSYCPFTYCGQIKGIDWRPNSSEIAFTIMSMEYSGEIYHFTFDETIDVVLGCFDQNATNFDPNVYPLLNRSSHDCRYNYYSPPMPSYGGGGYSGGDVGWPAITDSNGGMGFGCLVLCTPGEVLAFITVLAVGFGVIFWIVRKAWRFWKTSTSVRDGIQSKTTFNHPASVPLEVPKSDGGFSIEINMPKKD